MRNSLLLLSTLFACNRLSDDADVRLVGVGADPDEIGPAPTPYGGVVGYDRVELAGGGLALAHMGLGSFEEVGPGMVSFEPPYSAVVGFSYLFDQKLEAAGSLSFVAPVPPKVADTCYTVIEPEGPIGSFTTVDVGDYMEFVTEDGTQGFRMGRVPADVPPTAKNLFVYYSSVEPYAPTARTYLAPNPADPNNPLAMVEQVYKKANFPVGQNVFFRFPGGVARFDQGVASIPLPSASVGNASLRMPDALGPVHMSWNGPQFDAQGNEIGSGDISTCLEFYSAGRASTADLAACAAAAEYPHADTEYNNFKGQVYTGPWDTADGVHFEWQPGTEDSGKIAFSVRFMAPVSEDDANYKTPQMPADDGYRPATQCEEKDAEMRFDPSLLDDGTPIPTLQGDPFSKMVEVSCLLSDDGEFTLDQAALGNAMDYIGAHPAGGAIFFFSRRNSVEATVPAAKDGYDQRHDISPIAIAASDVRIGRFYWDGSASAGGAQ